jgi:lipoprotein NlpI
VIFLSYSAAADQSSCDSPQDPEAAIIDCTQSINSGKWKAHYLAAFYNNRAAAYRAKGDNDRAMADLNEAIRLNPKLAMAFNNRGAAYNERGDNDRAIADFNEAIRLDPKSGLAYFARGRSYFFAGSVERALADFNQASAPEPKDAHTALWVDIVSRRNNLPSRLSQASSQIDMTVWPAPVIRLFIDQMTPAAVLAAADDLDATRKKAQVCEANFYSRELSLTKGAKDEATRLFRLVASDCPHGSDEWDAANAELKALGVVP